MSTAPTTSEKTLNQKVGLAFGAVYVLVGLLGFLIANDGEFIGPQGDQLLNIFGVNGLHNVVHLLVGVALAGAAMSGAAASRSINMTIGVVYLLLGLVGWFIDGDTSANFLALDTADHLLHLASGILLIAVARGVGETTTARTA